MVAVPWDICPGSGVFVLREAQYWVNATIQRNKHFGQHKQSSYWYIYIAKVPDLNCQHPLDSVAFSLLSTSSQCSIWHRSSSKKSGWSSHSFIPADKEDWENPWCMLKPIASSSPTPALSRAVRIINHCPCSSHTWISPRASASSGVISSGKAEVSLGVLWENEVKKKPVAMDLPEFMLFSWGEGQGAVLNILTKEKAASSPVEHLVEHLSCRTPCPVFSWLGRKGNRTPLTSSLRTQQASPWESKNGFLLLVLCKIVTGEIIK